MARSLLTGIAAGVLFLGPPLAALAAAPAAAGHAAPTQAVRFRVALPLRNAAELEQLVALQGDSHSPLFHHFLSVAQFRASYGPSAATIARAAAALRSRGFSIAQMSTQSLVVSGTAAGVERAFSTHLGVVRDASGRSRLANSSAMTVPADLAAVGATVVGFESKVHVHLNSHQVPLNRYSAYGGYWFDDLKQAYTYPSNTVLDGKGSTVGVLMSSDVLDSDTNAAFAHEKFTSISGKTPLEIIRRPVFGGSPFGGGASAEASIDVQTSQGSAPGAQVELYNIPDLSDESIVAGYTAVDEDNSVDVVSSSFGGCELGYTAAYNNGTDYTGILKAEHELYVQGNSQGITFLASSGDEAGLECPDVSYFSGSPNAHFIPSVSSPADDPNVTAVGGTNLQTTTPPSPQPKTPVLTSKYVSENEIADAEIPYDIYGFGTNVSGGYWGSGSGVSKLFAKPSYQNKVNTGASMRSVPDVSMQMGGCPGGISVLPCHNGDSYSLYYVGGGLYGYIGTSLSSPEFAGLLALKIEAMKSRLGNANTLIYELAAANNALPYHFFHQGIPAANGVVTIGAGKSGYSAIVGVGTPYAQNFIGLPQSALSGTPQTVSNP